MKPISHVEPYSGYSGLTPRSLRLAKKYAVPKCVFARPDPDRARERNSGDKIESALRRLINQSLRSHSSRSGGETACRYRAGMKQTPQWAYRRRLDHRGLPLYTLARQSGR